MSDTREQILEQIKVQGDLVRQLKAAKESKEKVSFWSYFQLETDSLPPPSTTTSTIQPPHPSAKIVD